MRFFSFQQKLFIFLGICAIIFMLFFLSNELYKNFLLNQQIAKFQATNQQIKTNIDETLNQIEYFQSEKYQDKYAKEVLNKLQEGEKVLIFTHLEDQAEGLVPQSQMFDLTVEPSKMSPVEQWKEYFWGQRKLMLE